VSPAEFGLLVAAGGGAGLVGSIAGLASLISYPALLAVGVPPVTANMTNTVSLSLLAVGSISASRPELTGQRRRLLRQLPAGVLGGTAGAALLLLTPSDAFEKIVPALIAVASVAINTWLGPGWGSSILSKRTSRGPGMTARAARGMVDVVIAPCTLRRRGGPRRS